MKIDLSDLAKYLQANNIGLFFEPEPLKVLPSADGVKLYKINEIYLDNFLSKLTEFISRQDAEDGAEVGGELDSPRTRPIEDVDAPHKY